MDGATQTTTAKQYRPHEYQTYTTNFIISHPFCGVFLDMGLGKTVITLTALQDLKFYRWQVNRILIIAPKMVAQDTWQAEAAKWAHLNGLRIVSVLGSAKQREEALRKKADIYIINRENTKWIVDYLGFNWPFDTVVIDESSSFKSHKAERFKALKTVRPKISRLIELTGTPTPHGLTDLWSQIYLLDGGARLGRTISVYRDMYFVPDKRSRNVIFSYAPKEGAEKEILHRISDICISMKAEDYLSLPEIIYDDIPVILDAAAERKYKEFEKTAVLQTVHTACLEKIAAANGPCRVNCHFSEDVPDLKTFLAMNGYAFVPVTVGADNLTGRDPDGTTVIQYDDVITADNAAALSSKLLQLCNGAVYSDVSETGQRETVEVHDCKIEALLETIEQLNGQPTLICYYFRHDLDRLIPALEKTGLRLRVYKDSADKEAWNNGEIDLLLIHPASCSYGLNLQQGGHHIIWFSLTWNLEDYQQMNKRLHRQGQQYPVIVHRLIVRGGRDEDVIRSLEEKNAPQEWLLQSLKARIKSVTR